MLFKHLGDDADYVPQLHPCKPQFLFGIKLTRSFVQKPKSSDDEQDDRELQQMIKPLMSSDESNLIKEIYHITLRVRRDIQGVKGYNICTSKNSENAANVDHERL